jgi:hypothetical protein
MRAEKLGLRDLRSRIDLYCIVLSVELGPPFGAVIRVVSLPGTSYSAISSSMTSIWRWSAMVHAVLFGTEMAPMGNYRSRHQ